MGGHIPPLDPLEPGGIELPGDEPSGEEDPLDDSLKIGQSMSGTELEALLDRPDLLRYVFAAISVDLSEEEADTLAKLMHLDPEDRDADMFVTDLAVIEEGIPPKDSDLLRHLRWLFGPKANEDVIVINDVFVIPQPAGWGDDIVIDEITVLGGDDCSALCRGEAHLLVPRQQQD